MKIIETELPTLCKIEFYTERMNFSPDDAVDLYAVLFKSYAKFLGENKSIAKKKVALRLNDIGNGQFLMGAIVEYHEPEDEDTAGNWSLVITLQEEDLKDCKIYEATDQAFTIVMADVAQLDFRIRFNSSVGVFIKTQMCLIKALIKYMNNNAKEKEETIELEGIFSATFKFKDSGTIVTGKDKGLANAEVEKSIDFDGAMKRLVKDDAALKS